MGKADSWLGNSHLVWANDDRANDTARTISDKPSTITPVRNKVAQSATVVRIDTMRDPMERTGPLATVSETRVLVLGYKGHATIADTDLQRGDRFKHQGQTYTVTQILPSSPYRLIAVAEVTE
jgi:hypothetical protein